MGKQINYWMEYESFLPVAKAAIEQGCIIFKEHNGKVVQSKDLSIVTNDCYYYYFHLPVAGNVTIKTLSGGREVLDRIYTSSGNTIIEAGFSCIEDKRITRHRLYTISGYYNDSGEWILRPDCLTKLYNSLVRTVKKVAPYTELTDMRRYTTGDHCGEEFEWKHKEYVTAYCLGLRESGYSLCY